MWAQLVAAAAGVWLTASPAVLDSAGPARVSAHVLGPLAVLIALVAVYPVTRPVRWLNLLVAAWLLFAPWVLAYAPRDVMNSLAVGIALAVLACVRGRRAESFGGGWRVLWDPAAGRA